MLSGVGDALVGSGGDASNITKDESRLLAMQLMKLGQPRDRSATGDRIEKNVRSRFALLDVDLSSGDHGLGVSANGTRWYAVDKNFLYGSDSPKDYRHAAGDQIRDAFYSTKIVAGKARIIYDFGKPKRHQKVSITRRIITSKASLARGVKEVKKSIGKLAASWFATAKSIDPSSNAPDWISHHVTGTKSSKSITDLSGLNKSESPSVIFGSKAGGAASQKGKAQVQFAVSVREKKLHARLRLILSGYSKDVANGIKVQRHAHKVKGAP
jgi:hypothetical protein